MLHSFQLHVQLRRFLLSPIQIALSGSLIRENWDGYDAG